MIKVIKESSTRDSVELKFDSIKDMIYYIDSDEIYNEWDNNDSEVYIRVVDNNGVTTSVSIGIDRFSPECDIEVTITIGKNTYGPKYCDKYSEVIEWIKEVLIN